MAKKSLFSALFLLIASIGYTSAQQSSQDAHAAQGAAVEHVDHAGNAATDDHAGNAATDDHAGNAATDKHADGGHDAHGEKHEAPKLPMHAVELHDAEYISNSMVMVWLATLIIVLFCRAGAGKLSMVPQGFQNFAEWVIESLYNFFGGILGEHLVKRTFWFFGSTFLLIIVSNYLGLLPGVGTMGWGMDSHGHFARPMLRGGNADVNMTAAMALTFALLWIYWAVTENGLKGFLAHIFAPKGHFKGIMIPVMILIFGIVGLLEVVSIAIRPVALSFRLFGNIYGGEQTLEILMGLGGTYAGWATSLPFYFMELLVGGVQALVFTLLAAVFLKLICDHGDHGDDHAH